MSLMLGDSFLVPDLKARIVAGMIASAVIPRKIWTDVLISPSAAAPKVLPIPPFLAATAGETPPIPGWYFGGEATGGRDL